LGYVYKLRPSDEQAVKIDNWLDMLRSSYNWCLNDRIEQYNQQYVCGDYCDLRTKSEACALTCFVSKNGASGEPWKLDNSELEIQGECCLLPYNLNNLPYSGKTPRRSAGGIQITQLPILKISRPWYKDLDSTVLQQNIKRLDTAYKNFFEGKGFPNFKNRSNFRSFTYASGIRVDKNKIYLPKLGWMRFYNSRPIPDGFKIKSVTVRKKADGHYVSIRIEDNSVPDYIPLPIERINTAVGCDVGIKKLVSLSDGSQIKNPRFSRNKKMRRRLKIRQRSLARKKKRSKNRKKASNVVGRLHQKISNQRTAYQWKVAHKVTSKADLVVFEDLKVSNMKKRCKPKLDEATGKYLNNGQSRKVGLNRSISDAAWYELRLKTEYVAGKLGKRFEVVPPHHTSLECPECHHVDSPNRDEEKFLCSVCGYAADADNNAARNIKQRCLDKFNIKLTLKPHIKKDKSVRRDLPEPEQLTLGLILLETPTCQSTQGKRRYVSARNSKRSQPGNLSKQLSLFEDIKDA
jgi:putative transposase